MNEYSKLISKVPLFMLITAMIDKVNSSNAHKVRILAFQLDCTSLHVILKLKKILDSLGYLLSCIFEYHEIIRIHSKMILM